MFNLMLISKNNLINNILQIKEKNNHSKICAMVKANAYGVGLKQVVQSIEQFVDFFGVACLKEAKKVKNISNKKILIVGPLEKTNIDTRFSYTCSSIDDVKFLARKNKEINIHIKINTGMNRYGIKTKHELISILNIIKNSKLNLEGVFTHFATVDNFVEQQDNVFKSFTELVFLLGFKPIVHADNSFVNENYNHDYDMVRIGFNLYNNSADGFLPVVKIKSTIAQVNEIEKVELVGYSKRYIAERKMKVAVIPIGYADGFELKYIGLTLNIKGCKCKVLNVCMDCFMLDITNTSMKKGDEIYILDNFNSLKIYAEYSNSSEYEVMTRFSYLRADRKLID